jgi:ATP-binding cassette, subfamily F, member 3
MIQVTGLAKSYGMQVLFDDLNFTLGRGEKIGLVGRNGAGKSTLLKLLLQEESPDEGNITIPSRYRVATLKQHLKFTEPTILQEACLALPDDQKFDSFRAEKILMGLGFGLADFSRAPAEFSGGMQIRLNLAKVLLQDPDCLFLDEPTNYLDIVGMRWLTSWLRAFRGELILITHDSGFMDSVTSHTMGLWRQKLVKVPGGTKNFYAKLAEEEDIYEKTRANLDRKRKEMEDFVERFKAKASKATQAQSRMKMLEKMGEMNELAAVQTLDFSFNHIDCPGKTLLEIKDLSFGWDKTTPLFRDLNFAIQRNDKIAVIGKNGKGKSTLLNVIAGEITPDTGSIRQHPSMLLGHFGQTNISRLSSNSTVEEEISSANPGLGQQRVRSICGTMMFSGDLAKKKVSVLSGGERARVLIGKLLACPTNLLLLDEPSNHLDQQSVEALLEELKVYPGAVIVVTHSEEFVRQLAQKLIVFRGDRAEFVLGDYEDFLNRGGWGDEEESMAKPVVKRDRNEVKRLRTEIIQERSRTLSPLKKRIEVLEHDIDAQEKRANTLENKLIEGGGDVASLAKELGVLRKSIDTAFEDLTKVSLDHDALLAGFEKRLTELGEA